MVARAMMIAVLGGAASGLLVGPQRRVARLKAAATMSAPAVEQQQRVALSMAERARTAAELGISSGAALSTLARDLDGFPFTTYVDYVLDAEGAPVILLKKGAEHSLNLDANGRASVLLRGSTPVSASDAESFGAAAARVTLVGLVERIPDDDPDLSVIVANFGVAHVYAEDLLRDMGGEFELHRIVPESVFYVGGYGVAASWIDVEDYADSMADVVAKDASALVTKLNGDSHKDDLRVVAMHLLGYDEASLLLTRVANVDRLGVDFRVATRGPNKSTEEYRVAFRASARSLEDAKSEVIKLLQEAWEMDQGVEWDGAYAHKPIVKKAQ